MSSVEKWWVYHFGREITPGERLRVQRFARTLGAKNPLFILAASIIYSTTESLKADEEALLRIGPSVSELLNKISQVVSSASNSSAVVAQNAARVAQDAARAEASVAAVYETLRRSAYEETDPWRKLRRRSFEYCAVFAVAFSGTYAAIKAALPTDQVKVVPDIADPMEKVAPVSSWRATPMKAEKPTIDDNPDLDR